MVASNEMASGDPGRMGGNVQDQGARPETANKTPHGKTTTCGASANPTLRAQDDLILRGDALREAHDLALDGMGMLDVHALEGRLIALPAAPTFTAADVDRAYRLALQDAWLKAFSIPAGPRTLNAILALTPPADLAQRVKE